MGSRESSGSWGITTSQKSVSWALQGGREGGRGGRGNGGGKGEAEDPGQLLGEGDGGQEKLGNNTQTSLSLVADCDHREDDPGVGGQGERSDGGAPAPAEGGGGA